MNKASKSARWLGFVPFEAISDERNEEPVIRIADEPNLQSGIATFDPYDLPDDEDLRPRATLDDYDFRARQPFKLVISGEKTSLKDVLYPLSEKYGTDLYLPSGEITDTQLYKMAKTGAEDGRKMIVIVLADCDPAGYQMAVSIGHKLRAFKDSKFHGLRFSVIAPCLTVEQVNDLGLPSDPLKDTETRAVGWLDRYGVEQTEIDALATLQPEVFREIVEGAVAPYYDATLDDRVDEAKQEWQRKADATCEEALDTDEFRELEEETKACLQALQDNLEHVRDAVDELAVELPPIKIPKPDIGELPDPLVSSDMPLYEHISILERSQRLWMRVMTSLRHSLI